MTMQIVMGLVLFLALVLSFLGYHTQRSTQRSEQERRELLNQFPLLDNIWDQQQLADMEKGALLPFTNESCWKSEKSRSDKSDLEMSFRLDEHFVGHKSVGHNPVGPNVGPNDCGLRLMMGPLNHVVKRLGKDLDWNNDRGTIIAQLVRYSLPPKTIMNSHWHRAGWSPDFNVKKGFIMEIVPPDEEEYSQRMVGLNKYPITAQDACWYILFHSWLTNYIDWVPLGTGISHRRNRGIAFTVQDKYLQRASHLINMSPQPRSRIELQVAFYEHSQGLQPQSHEDNCLDLWKPIKCLYLDLFHKG